MFAELCGDNSNSGFKNVVILFDNQSDAVVLKFQNQLEIGFTYEYSFDIGSRGSGSDREYFIDLYNADSNQVVQTLERGQLNTLPDYLDTPNYTTLSGVFVLPQTGNYYILFRGTGGFDLFNLLGQDYLIDRIAVSKIATSSFNLDIDVDNDGIPNHFDLDSDGDGCPDAIEGSGIFTTTNLVSSSINGGNTGTNFTGVSGVDPIQTNLGTVVNSNGIPTLGSSLTAATQNIGSSQDKNINSSCTDTDGDGINDYVDLDDDNDGILDIDECSSLGIGLIDGRFDEFTEQTWSLLTTTDDDGFPISVWDTHSTSTTNTIELISGTDGFGFEQRYKMNVLSPQGDDYVGFVSGGDYPEAIKVNVPNMVVGEVYEVSFYWANAGRQNTERADLSPKVFLPDGTIWTGATKTYNPNIWYTEKILFTATMASADLGFGIVVTAAGVKGIALDGISVKSKYCLDDTDGDSIPNSLDLDSDGDGCPDAIEGDGDFTNTDLVEDTAIAGGNTGGGFTGVSGVGGVQKNLGKTVDTTVGSATYGVPIVGTASAAVTQGVGISQNKRTETCTDTDTDGVPDYVDLDDDNDGILDLDEMAFNQELFIPTSVAANSVFGSNGFTYSNTGFYNNDTNYDQPTLNSSDYCWLAPNTTIGHYVQLDFETPKSIIDVKTQGRKNSAQYVETYTLKGKVDGENTWQAIGGVYNANSDRNTIVTNTVTSTITNWIAIRIIPQTYERGIAMRFGVTVGESLPLDTDNDGIPNRLDLDSDGDGCPDAIEADGSFTNADLVEDTDIDGGNTGAGFTGISGVDPVQTNLGTVVNSDGIPTLGSPLTAATQNIGTSQNKNIENCTDTDGDGISDNVDLDDDNDGILDTIETYFGGCSANDVDIRTPASVTTELTYTTTSYTPGVDLGDLRNVYDAELATSIAFTNNQNADGKVVFEVTPVYPMEIRGLEIDNIVFYSTLLGKYKVQGYNGANWVDVTLDIDLGTTTTNANLNSGTLRRHGSYYFEVSQNNGVYEKYRLLGQTNAKTYRDSATTGVREVVLHPVIGSLALDPNCIADSDEDGVPNHLDLDSDGDGCPDAVEAGFKSTFLQNATGSFATDPAAQNGQVTGSYGANGLSNNIENNDSYSAQVIDSNFNNAENEYALYAVNDAFKTCTDTDNDGILDVNDLDDDNDGILDTDEGYAFTPPGTNCPAASPISGGTTFMHFTNQSNGLNDYASASSSSSFAPANWDATVVDTIENIDYGNGLIYREYGTGGGTFDNQNSYQDPVANNGYYEYRFTTKSGFTKGLINAMKFASITANTELSIRISKDNFKTNYEMQSAAAFSNNSIVTFDYPYVLEDNSSYSIRVYLHTSVSASTGTVIGFDNVYIYNTATSNLTTSQQQDLIDCQQSNLVELDTDNDGIPNHLDLDSDGDGCPDALEGDGTFVNADLVEDTDMDGGNTGADFTGVSGVDPVQTNLGTVVNSDGIPTLGSPLTAATQGVGTSIDKNIESCTDTDGDGISDNVDLDDDNDGVLDIYENCTPVILTTATDLSTAVSSQISDHNSSYPASNAIDASTSTTSITIGNTTTDWWEIDL